MSECKTYESLVTDTIKYSFTAEDRKAILLQSIVEIFHSVRGNNSTPFILVGHKDKQDLTIESVAAQSDGQSVDSATFHGNLRYYIKIVTGNFNYCCEKEVENGKPM